ncbi:MAG: hypothetical protein ACM3ZA_03020 [Bacillota bacterium]
MFGFRRHHHPCGLLTLVFAILGVKALKRSRCMTDEERQEVQAKSRLFRAKLREAWQVWEPDEDKPDEKPPTVTEG